MDAFETVSRFGVREIQPPHYCHRDPAGTLRKRRARNLPERRYLSRRSQGPHERIRQRLFWTEPETPGAWDAVRLSSRRCRGSCRLPGRSREKGAENSVPSSRLNPNAFAARARRFPMEPMQLRRTENSATCRKQRCQCDQTCFVKITTTKISLPGGCVNFLAALYIPFNPFKYEKINSGNALL